jgi:hypothetical protein
MFRRNMLWFSPHVHTHHSTLESTNFMNCTVPTFYDYSICKILTYLEFGIVHLWQDISWPHITHGILAVLIQYNKHITAIHITLKVMYVVRSWFSHRILLAIWSWCDYYSTWQWHDTKQTAHNGGNPLRPYALLQCEHVTNCESMYMS